MAKSINKRVQLICEDVSLTHQSFKDECDIRNIMAKYKRSGIVTHLNAMQGQFVDMSSVPDYHEAMNIIVKSQETFDALPSDLRKRFGNDPANLLDFVSNPDNRSEMIKLGMIIEQPLDANMSNIRVEDAPTSGST